MNNAVEELKSLGFSANRQRHGTTLYFAAEPVGTRAPCFPFDGSSSQASAGYANGSTARFPMPICLVANHRCTILMEDLPFGDILGTGHADPMSLANLGLVDRRMKDVILSTEFALNLARELSRNGAKWADGCRGLEQLAVGIAVSRLCASDSKNHIYFSYGGGTCIPRSADALLDGAAALAQRHRLLNFHADGHMAADGPAGSASRCSCGRAQAVLDRLTETGVAEERLSMRGWGRQVSLIWSEPEETEPRAELFFIMGNKEFPVREDYYNECDPPPVGWHGQNSPGTLLPPGARFLQRMGLQLSGHTELQHEGRLPVAELLERIQQS
eukprot:gnl/TRDRNA2_/TRDRNA2_94850_c0_seq1.p1 gnl/TRDRNA2_/TRDRNA2_94850_c0~~gnl/TRDRNA2_/TRDRNA2_94850_c0_seq1.p1  ORF type:complete len:329 (-),score=27.62 gnl/TRDRNA2_/TRDRNA2_94850_c0_seq1:322-1308(-)